MKNAVIAVDKSKSFRIRGALTTELVEDARKVHMTTPVATATLGRVLTAGGLMAMDLKDPGYKLTLQFKGDGPAHEVLITASGDGKVKGYISNSAIILPLREDGKLDVGGAVGQGTLTVIKDIGMKEPYAGKTDIVSGEIGEDLAAYFFMSEQTNTTVALGVKVDIDQSVAAAGGFIAELLPEADERAIDALEEVIGRMKPISETVAESAAPSDLLENVFHALPDEFAVEMLEERELSWECDCTRERLEQAVLSIGEKDMREIIDEDGGAELVCQFCRRAYQFDKPELLELLEESLKK